MRRASLLPTTLIALASMLAATLVYQLTAPAGEYEIPPTPRRAPVLSVSLPAPFTPPGIAQFAEIDERPLFVSERRPFKEEREAPPPEPRKPPSATLVGVILDGNRKIAIAKVGGRSVNLVPGAIIEGWSVVSIETDRVAFKVGDERYELRLPKPVVAPPTQPRTAAAPPRPPRMPPPPGFAPGQIPGRP